MQKNDNYLQSQGEQEQGSQIQAEQSNSLQGEQTQLHIIDFC